MRPTGTARLALLTALVAGSLTGMLGGTAGAATGVVSKSTVETQASKILAQETGQKPPKVTCKSGLPAKVGATIHCTVVPHGSTLQYPAVVTVRRVKGSTAYFHVQVGQAIGQANKAKFCADVNTLADQAVPSGSASAYLKSLEQDQQMILELQSTAPSKIVDAAGTFVQAVQKAITTQSVTGLSTTAVVNAQKAIVTFCGIRIPQTTSTS